MKEMNLKELNAFKGKGRNPGHNPAMHAKSMPFCEIEIGW
jgi:hypothetical protein